MINYFDEDDIKKILEEVFDKRGYTYNQILQAGNIGDVFLELYQLSSNNFPELENSWKAFVKKLKDEDLEGGFGELILEIEVEQEAETGVDENEK